MANYSNDHDLLGHRPNILSFGETDWDAMHTEAKRSIDRAIEALWYKEAALAQGLDWTVTQLDSAKLDATQFKTLSCYKTLELVYRYLMKDTPEPDGFMRQMALFSDLYDRELQDLLALGFSYDWDATGTIEADERLQPRIRRLQRM